MFTRDWVESRSASSCKHLWDIYDLLWVCSSVQRSNLLWVCPAIYSGSVQLSTLGLSICPAIYSGSVHLSSDLLWVCSSVQRSNLLWVCPAIYSGSVQRSTLGLSSDLLWVCPGQRVHKQCTQPSSRALPESFTPQFSSRFIDVHGLERFLI